MNEEPIKRGGRRGVVKKVVTRPVSEVTFKEKIKKVAIKKTTVKKGTPKKAVATARTLHNETTTQKRGIKSPFSDEMMAEVTETNVDKETVKMLTGSLSPRLKEKLALYELWYRTESPKYAEAAAKVFGYGFIVSGLLLAFTLTLGDSLKQYGLVAAIECSLSGCSELMATTTDVIPPLILPTVAFVTAPVVDPLRDTDVTFTINNATEHSLTFTSHEIGVTTPLEAVGNDGAETFMYRLPTRNLAPGDYEITVRATASDNLTKTEFFGGTFTVPTTTPLNDEPVVTEVTSNETTADVAVEHASLSKESVEEATSTEQVVLPEAYDTEAEQILGVSTTTEKVENEIDEETLTETEGIQSNEVGEVFNITIAPGVLANQYKVSIVPTYEYSTVELSIRALNSTAPLYLGLANSVKNGWLYWLDASNLPVGNYRLVVTGHDDGVVKDSAEIRFVNELPAPLYLTSPEYEQVKRALATDLETLATATTSDLASFTDPRSDLIPDLLNGIPGLTEASESTTFISAYAEDLNPLLRSYAAARQSGDETALRLAEAAIDDLLTSILDSELANSVESVFVLESELRVAFTELKERITSIENYKKERTAEASSVDTDEDGIADYDEYLLYDTDPRETDTDRDGVNDGVEIGLGYDPTDATPEAVVRLSSPKEATYVDDTVLGITAITPLLIYETNAQEPFIQSEISGFGLPNSFVTLFIYSEPTVVVVKTDDAGKFSYTFTKVLQDGEHEAYATLIDNTGTIVLRSSAFRFAKSAESYTYTKVVPQAAAVWSAPVLADTSKTYNLVATMGVIAFGLILLLMGLVLRQDREKPEK